MKIELFKPFFTSVDYALDQITRPIFTWTLILIYAMYIITFFGFLSIDPSYVKILSTFMQVFIGIILAIRFSPFRHHVFREHDSVLIFTSAIFILTNVGLTEYFMKLTTFMKDTIIITV